MLIIPLLQGGGSSQSLSFFSVFFCFFCLSLSLSLSACAKLYFSLGAQLGGSGDVVSSLIMGLFKVTIWVMGVIHPLTKSS